jgi:germination protein M
VPVLRDVPATKAVGTAALQALLDGPNDTELGASPAMYTDIPDGTKLLGLTIDHGVALVSLTKEFEAGGDTTTIRGRTAQVVFTLTQFATITSVRLLIDDDLPHLASLVSPFTRAGFTDVLPAIWVDRPAWGGVLGNPGEVSGLANVFEARFRIQVLDASGRSLVDEPATASCGTGCWGTFDVTIHYAVGSPQWGTLRVYDRSAKDGSPEHAVDYPIWLTPS